MSTPDACLASPNRRHLLRATPGSLLWALGGGLLGGGRIAFAQPLTEGAVPAVDRVAVRVVTDSYPHAFEPSRTIRGLRIDRIVTSLSKNAPPRSLLDEWGLSLHLESARGSETRQVLIDFRFSATALNTNLDLIGIDPAKLDAMLLSHGHYDHFGGLVGFLQAHGGKLKRDLPFVLGFEECFCTREAGIGANVGNFGALDREAIRAARLQLQFAERPSLIAGHAFSTGRIPTETFQRVLAPSRMAVG